MVDRDFKSMASNQIIDHVYDSRKDFIILGLCGKVGSGVSTVSEILEKSFEDLQLPDHGFDNSDLYAAHEYRILYTYAANKNWKSFYKIRTSALITRHILAYSAENFVTLLTKLCSQKQIEDKTREGFAQFFTREMEFDLAAYCKELEIDLTGIQEPWRLLTEDSDRDKLLEHAKKKHAKKRKGDPEYECIVSETKKISFRYAADTKICLFGNQGLSNLLDVYAERRTRKSGFWNPFWYLILKQYLYDFLPNAASGLWAKVGKWSKGLPIQALQHIGNNLRISKEPYFTSVKAEFSNDGYTCLAEDINLAIKVLRAYQLVLREHEIEADTMMYNPRRPSESVRTVVVIDSIKNPYESMYLKERYSNYYLVGIYTEDQERRRRLREKQHLTDDDITAIDIVEQNSEFKRVFEEYRENLIHPNIEYKSLPIIEQMYKQFEDHGLLDSISYISPFVLQNVSQCLHSADILINNRTDNSSHLILKKTLLRYVCLIMNPALVLPTAVERCMQIAYTAKLNSGCISRQVGAVLTDDGYHLLSIGWNQQPEGQLPCSYRDLCELAHHWIPDGYSDFETDDGDTFHKSIKKQVEDFFDMPCSPLSKQGKLPCYCFKDYYNSQKKDKNQVHTRALHAEETAFLNLGANNTRVENGILFTTSSPCELCSKKAMFLGVSKIYYVEPYSGVSQKHVMSIGERRRRPELILFTGAIGTAYTKLYTPLLPRKDENEMWLGAKMDFAMQDSLKKKMAVRKEEASQGTDEECHSNGEQKE